MQICKEQVCKYFEFLRKLFLAYNLHKYNNRFLVCALSIQYTYCHCSVEMDQSIQRTHNFSDWDTVRHHFFEWYPQKYAAIACVSK